MNTTATTTTVSSKSTNSGNIRGTVGRAIPKTQFKIVNPEDLKESYPDGTQGLILVRGPGVMKGYYNNESATSAAFRAGDGWFDTGDLGWIVPSTTAPAPARITASFSSFLFGKSNSNKMAGCLVLTGRAKDTIVLNSGENVEPRPIEDALCSSPFIKFAAVIGQGRRSLGALIVPDTDALDEVVVDKAAQSIEIEKIIKAEVKAACEHRVRWEHVSAFTILEKPFCVEDGTLTKTMKIRRAVIHQVYKEEIAEVEAKLR
jgi:long-chain acyl-CoA synthetase